jgi:hypothetical protein
MAKFHVPVEQVADVRNWFASRGGVVMWTNKEIGNNRPEVITPKLDKDGKPTGAPHWAYIGEPAELQPADLDVRTETDVPVPAEWFPVCEHCNGGGKRTVTSLATARQEDVASVSYKIAHGEIQVNNYDGTVFDCTWCQGTGHIDRHLSVAVRKKYWGYDISATGKSRAEKYAKKLGAGVKWYWEHVGYGRAELKFYREKIEPFVME